MGVSRQEQAFGVYLRDRGFAFTAERQAVLRQVLAAGRHFQADELYLRLARDKARPVSRATVYRTLRLLCDCGLVRKVAFVERHSHYEHLFGHDHLICQKCGRIIEFRDQSVSRALARVCKAKKFQAASRKVEVVGLCAKCS
ncbi:Ferric uptake regulation protein [subsurface metagenome]